VNGCQANCVNPDSEKSCHLPFTEGCACEEGLILSGDECVKVKVSEFCVGYHTSAGGHIGLKQKILC
jgi:hypothetical protein